MTIVNTIVNGKGNADFLYHRQAGNTDFLYHGKVGNTV